MNRRWFLKRLAASAVLTPALLEALAPRRMISLAPRLAQSSIVLLDDQMDAPWNFSNTLPSQVDLNEESLERLMKQILSMPHRISICPTHYILPRSRLA